MTTLEKGFSLSNLQVYVSEVERTRGFDNQDVMHKCLLLGEEIGELFKAIRCYTSMGIAKDSVARDVGDELADVLNYVVAIANRCSVDLDTAYLRKEQSNRERTWTTGAR